MRAGSLLLIISFILHSAAMRGLMSETDQNLETKCQRVEVFFFKLRKDLVEGTWNPAKAMANMLLKGNEFGRISVQEASKDYKSMLSDLNLKTEESFALALAEQFVTVPYCMRVSDAATMVFKILKLRVINHPDEFLRTLLDKTSPIFAIEFILYTLHNFLECSDTFIFQIIDSYYDSREGLIEEFIKLYEWILTVHTQSEQKSQAMIFKNAFNAVLKQGQAFMGIFLLYQIKGILLPHLDQNLNWIVDNVFLYKITEFLSSIAKGVTSFHEKEQIHELTLFFNSLQARLTTRDVLHIDNTLVKQGEIVRECPQCRAEETLQRAQERLIK